MGKPKNSGPDTAKKATDSTGGKRAAVKTTKTGGGQGAETVGEIISWPNIQKIHEEHDRKPRGQ